MPPKKSDEMRKKGTIEAFSNTILLIVCIVIFMLTVYIVFSYFAQFSVTVNMHEKDRKINDFAEGMLTNCSLLYSEGVFDARILNEIQKTDNLTERCFHYCDYGMKIDILDKKTNERWIFGYIGEVNSDTRTKTFKAGIYNEKSSFIDTTTTTTNTCPPNQIACDQYLTESDCLRTCCAFDKLNNKCKPCSGLSFSQCYEVNYDYGFCTYDIDSDTCKYTGTNLKKAIAESNIHPGEIDITMYDDLATMLACGAEKAAITGEAQKLFLSKDEKYGIAKKGSQTEAVSIKGGQGKICVNMPYDVVGTEMYPVEMITPYTGRKDFCKIIEGSTFGSLDFSLDNNVNITFTKSGNAVTITKQ